MNKNTKTMPFASLIAAMILPFSVINYAQAEQQGGVICDPDISESECIKNAPTYSIDGISLIELVPFIPLFVVITVSILIIVLYLIKIKYDNG